MPHYRLDPLLLFPYPSVVAETRASTFREICSVGRHVGWRFRSGDGAVQGKTSVPSLSSQATTELAMEATQVHERFLGHLTNPSVKMSSVLPPTIMPRPQPSGTDLVLVRVSLLTGSEPFSLKLSLDYLDVCIYRKCTYVLTPVHVQTYRFLCINQSFFLIHGKAEHTCVKLNRSSLSPLMK